MKKLFAGLFLFLFLAVQPVLARSGCCSHHGGVQASGCGCNDGTPLSQTCAPYYVCQVQPQINTPVYEYPTKTPIPTRIYIPPTSTPTPTETPTPTPTKVPVKKTASNPQVSKNEETPKFNIWKFLFGWL